MHILHQASAGNFAARTDIDGITSAGSHPAKNGALWPIYAKRHAAIWARLASMKPGEKINPKWASHYQTLQALREKLVRAHEKHRSDAYADASASIEPEGADPVDQANDEAEREVVIAELHAEEARLNAIAAALQRIRDGTYGICIETGKPISAARLHAIPWTPYSHEAAARLEQDAKNATAVRR